MSTDPYYGDLPPLDAPTQPELQPVASPSVVATDVAPKPTRAIDWRRLGLIGAIALVVLALIGGIAIAAHSALSHPDARAAAQGYCDAAKRQNYAKTYSYFSPTLQAVTDSGAYPLGAQAADTIQGKVTACNLGKLTVAKDGKSATLAVTFTRQKLGAQALTWQFAQVKTDVWQFTAAPDTATMSLTVATMYCQDVTANKLTDVYQLFTANEQQSVGAATQFTQDMQQTGQYLGTLQKCQLQKITPSKDGKTSVIKLGIWFSNYQNIPGEIDVQTASDGSAKIDAVNLSALGNAVPYPLPLTLLQQILQLFGAATGNGS